MNFKGLKRIMAAALAFCVMAASTPFVLAAETDTIKLVFTDVTGEAGTEEGQCKIKVSLESDKDEATIVQTALHFASEDGMVYEGADFLLGENNPDEGYAQTDTANSTGNILIGITSINGLQLSSDGTTDLFVLNFKGDAGDKVKLKSGDADLTYITVGGADIKLGVATAEKEFTASTEDVGGVKAVVKLTMDKVNFNTTNGKASGIELIITNESNKHTTSFTLSDKQRDKTQTTPTFVFEKTLVKGTYTVELRGIGYTTYKKTGVTFAESLNLTNSDFKPGDIDCDGDVDADDKALYDGYIANKEYSDAADINRDTFVNSYDDVYPKDNTTGGGSTGGTTGGDNGGSTGGDNGGTGGNGGGSGGGGGGGAGGGGGSSSGGGAGGGGSTGGGSSMGGGSFGGGTTTTPTNPTKTFTDLTNYGWAENAIYTLKAKGIISGISETEYAPSNNIKRGDFILIITRMLKLENTFTENFADVPTTAYYYDALGKAKAAGIASGDGVNFMPENTITRQDLITLAYRAFLNAGYITETTDYSVLDQFADKAEITDYAQAPLASMVAAGIITGDGTNVNPKGFATRAEVAVMCERLLALIK